MRPYRLLFSSSSPSAPSQAETLGINITPNTAKTIPHRNEVITFCVKSSSALSCLPSPIYFDISATPPVPNRKPAALSIITTGMMKLSAVNAILPAKFDTKSPSTTPYIDVNTIMAIDGTVNLISLPIVK